MTSSAAGDGKGGDGDGKGGGKGNPVAVAIGRYCFFSRGCVLRPPGKLYRGYVLLDLFSLPLTDSWFYFFLWVDDLFQGRAILVGEYSWRMHGMYEKRKLTQ